MYVVVAGCGRVGAQLALELSYQKNDVVIIDRNRSSFRRLGSAFNGISLEGVAFDEEILAEAEIDRADAFIATTNFDNTNLMAAEIAKRIYNVPTVIARLYNPQRELTFFKMGIDYICGTTFLAEQIKEKLFQGEELILQHERVELGIQVLEFVVPAEVAGMPAGYLTSGVSSKLLSLARNNVEIPFDDETSLEAGDHALIVMRKEGWEILRNCVTEKALESPACRNYILPRSVEATSVAQPETKKLKIIVAGCSAVGAHLAYLLSFEGHEVAIIEENKEKFKRLPPKYEGLKLEGVCFEEDVLLKAGVKDADAFAAVTKLDNHNLMSSEVARRIFKVPHIVARLFNMDKEMTYQKLGIKYVCGTRIIAHEILERVSKPVLHIRASCFNNMFYLAELACPPSWNGKTVMEVQKNRGIKIAFIGRRSTGHLSDDKFVLKSGDTIMVLGLPSKLQGLEGYLKKNVKG
ncbi:MAG: NAD-binding protein [Actinomycetota bacterium]|nr:NAD-binding protein [Actinomycetota bacterium]